MKDNTPLFILAGGVAAFFLWNYTQKGFFWKTQSQREKEDAEYDAMVKEMYASGFTVKKPEYRGQAAADRRRKQGA